LNAADVVRGCPAELRGRSTRLIVCSDAAAAAADMLNSCRRVGKQSIPTVVVVVAKTRAILCVFFLIEKLANFNRFAK